MQLVRVPSFLAHCTPLHGDGATRSPYHPSIVIRHPPISPGVRNHECSQSASDHCSGGERGQGKEGGERERLNPISPLRQPPTCERNLSLRPSVRLSLLCTGRGKGVGRVFVSEFCRWLGGRGFESHTGRSWRAWLGAWWLGAWLGAWRLTWLGDKKVSAVTRAAVTFQRRAAVTTSLEE